MGGNKKHQNNKQQQKKKTKNQAEHQQKQQEKQEERKTKRQKKREKAAFNQRQHENDIKKFKDQLAKFGLRLKEVGGDGNCLFRAIADQLEGNENQHKKYRADVIQILENNKEAYAPFIEDDETIDDYIKDMQKDGTWGGQIEIQVLSMHHQFNVIVHQVDHPIMSFMNFNDPNIKTIHLSYHLGEHYNSVRLATDFTTGVPAQNIGNQLKEVDVKLSVDESSLDETKQTASSNNSDLPTRDQIVQYSCQLTGCIDPELMEQVLIECFGIDEVITYDNIENTLPAIKQILEDLELKNINSHIQNLTLDEPEIPVSKDSPKTERTKKLKQLEDDEMMIDGQGNVVKMPPRNKNCPCESKHKYKKCCYPLDLKRKEEYIKGAQDQQKKDLENSKKPQILQL